MTRAESPEPASGGGGNPSFSFDKFFHDAHDRGIVAAVEERPAEAAVTAVGAVAAGAAAIYLTKGGALANIFRNTLRDEMAASPKLLASLSRTGVPRLALGQLEPDVERLVTSKLPLTTETPATAAIHTSGFPLTAENRAAGALPSGLHTKPWIGHSTDMGIPTHADGLTRAAASGVKTFEEADYRYVPHSTAPMSDLAVFAQGGTKSGAFNEASIVKSPDPLSAFDQSGYRFVPFRNLSARIRLGDGIVMRPVEGPSRIVFAEDNSVQHVLYCKGTSPIERADLMLRAGFADLIHTDKLALEAASKVEGQSIGFRSYPIERIASPEETHQIASEGARAYVEMDAQGANRFTHYLTERFGPMTKDSQEWGRHISTNTSSPESGWNWRGGPATDALIQNGLPIRIDNLMEAGP